MKKMPTQAHILPRALEPNLKTTTSQHSKRFEGEREGECEDDSEGEGS